MASEAVPCPEYLDLSFPELQCNVLIKTAGWEVTDVPNDTSKLVVKRSAFKNTIDFRGAVRHVQFTPDAKFLVVTTAMNELFIGEPLFQSDTWTMDTLPGHCDIAMSEGQWLAAYGRQMVYLWSLQTAERPSYAMALPATVTAVVFSPHEQWMLVVMQHSLWGVRLPVSQEAYTYVELPFPSPEVVVGHFRWLCNERQLMWQTGARACIYDLASGLSIRNFQNASPMTIEELLDPASDPTLKGLSLRAHTDRDIHMHWTAEGLVTSTDDGSVYRWDTVLGELLHFQDCRYDGVKCCAVSSSVVVTAAEGHSDVQLSFCGKRCNTVKLSSAINVLYGLFARATVAIVHTKDRVMVVSLATQAHVRTLQVNRTARVAAVNDDLADNDLWIIEQSFPHMCTLIVMDGVELKVTLSRPRLPEAIRCLADNDTLILVFATLHVECWSLTTGTMHWEHDLPVHKQPNRTEWALSANGSTLVLLLLDRHEIAIYHLSEQANLPQVSRVPMMRSDPVALRVSQCGAVIAYATENGSVHVFDVVSQRHITVSERCDPRRVVMHLSFAPNGTLAVTYESGFVQVVRPYDWNHDETAHTCSLCHRVTSDGWSLKRHMESCKSLHPSQRIARSIGKPRTTCRYCHASKHPCSLQRHERTCEARIEQCVNSMKV